MPVKYLVSNLGQMIWMDSLDAMLFACSPRVASLKELEERNLHLSDIPLHDITRDLILFNHQRLAEIELGKQLEQKKVEMNLSNYTLINIVQVCPYKLSQ